MTSTADRDHAGPRPSIHSSRQGRSRRPDGIQHPPARVAWMDRTGWTRRTTRLGRLTVALGLALGLFLGAAGCGGSGKDGTSTGPSLTPTEGAGGLQIFAVTGLPNLHFSAMELVARPGRIRVDFSVAPQSPPHNFVIPRIPEAHTRIVSAGESQSITFSVTEPGSYPVVCTLHPNMTATLKIL
ncbi:hypothetical protein ThrDRAFT_01562 [Frankia casuarinae]|nr:MULTISPECIES: hypothetical protein [Frankia]ETA02590.1 hypothetical protein CcI6DRAFT_01978 [Frankia sp. CcI6]EYT92786.1 hypothetical protein ThrDRAFT_01562 [Frankia casuarinae]KEZ37975.1 hypothetical protein CEDDRAFT_00824 [Frankia sp. CeD]KFB07121.1 hypothetical protein ALLO2DRAFT_00416 [Frankia sp. Allo2]